MAHYEYDSGGNPVLVADPGELPIQTDAASQAFAQQILGFNQPIQPGIPAATTQAVIAGGAVIAGVSGLTTLADWLSAQGKAGTYSSSLVGTGNVQASTTAAAPNAGIKSGAVNAATGAAVAVAGGAAAAVAAGGGPGLKVNLSFLLPLFTALDGVPIIGPWLAGIGDGAVVAFDSLPSAVQDALVAAFSYVGYQLVKGAGMTILNDVTHKSGSTATQAIVVGSIPPGWVPAWKTNGVYPVQFYREQGKRKLGVLKKNGRFKTWTPKRPVVLYAGGAVNVKNLIKAGRIITKQLGELRTITEKMQPKARKPREKMVTEGQAMKMVEAASRR